jgi:prepilin-type N-terminal cleavage/methylation domain-containing protein
LLSSNSMAPVSSTRGNARGFTLVELMIVVVIVCVLAVIGIYGVRKYVSTSKTGEAVQMIGSIKAAQEAFKDETFAYLDVTDSLTSYYPDSSHPGQKKVAWGGDGPGRDNWKALGVSPAGAMLFVYACDAGPASENVASPGQNNDITISNWPGALGQPWYVVKAVADLDGGGDQRSVYVGASFTNQIFSANEGE